MKKRITNIVELALYAVSIFMLTTMTAEFYDGYHVAFQKVRVINEIIKTPVYPVLLAVLWGFGILMCIVSVFSKSKDKDGALHVVLPIITMIVTDVCLLGMFVTVSNISVFNGIMLAIVVVSFIKRSSVIVPKAKEAPNASISHADELKKYKELLDTGAITQEEYEAKKKQLLGL